MKKQPKKTPKFEYEPQMKDRPTYQLIIKDKKTGKVEVDQHIYSIIGAITNVEIGADVPCVDEAKKCLRHENGKHKVAECQFGALTHGVAISEIRANLANLMHVGHDLLHQAEMRKVSRSIVDMIGAIAGNKPDGDSKKK